MILEQYYLSCLSHASYLVGDESSGVAAVVDPQRDVGQYVEDAARAGLRIAHVLETHVHADFVSGHLELAAQTGATIWFGEAAAVDIACSRLADGQRLSLGDVVLEVMDTPGHTLDSVCLLVYEHAGDRQPHAVLTGDTLFVGDVGRPDLLAAEGQSAEAMARRLYRSVQRLLTLPDTTRVLPAHGAGSACGRSLSTATSSTIGEERRTNHALQPMSEDAFVAVVTEGQPARPPYFALDVALNRTNRGLLQQDRPPARLGLDDVLAVERRGGALLDTRSDIDFAAGHLRGSVHASLAGRFAEYAGDIVGADQEIALLCDAGTELEGRVRLARIGFDRVLGALSSPERVLAERPDLVEVSSRLTATALLDRLERVPDLLLVDVRNPAEVAEGTIPEARHIPLAELSARAAAELDPASPLVLYCASGQRSLIASSLLAARGFADVSDLVGGFTAWQALGQRSAA